MRPLLNFIFEIFRAATAVICLGSLKVSLGLRLKGVLLPLMILHIVVVKVNDHKSDVILAAIVYSLLSESGGDLAKRQPLLTQA
jgi:hypothetical protein